MGDLNRTSIREEWEARPPALRLFVAGTLAATVFSLVRDPSAFSFPAILFTLVFLGLLKKLWDGERAMWWLFVILSGAGLAAGLAAAFDEPAAWAGVAAGVVALLLLVTDSTRSFVAGESGGPVP